MKQLIPPILLPFFENHMVLGCVLITLGTLGGLFSPLIKVKADRVQTRTAGRRNLWRLFFWIVLVAGPVLVGFGTWLTIAGTQQNASAQAAHADDVFKKTQEENARTNREINNKLQEMQLAIRAAKQDEARTRTEEKINIIQDNFNQWAEDFAKRRPDKERQLREAKSASLQKELQISSESTPLFSYTIRFVQEAIRAYSKQSGRQIRNDIPVLPDNFFATDVNNVERAIHFIGGKAIWSFSVSASPPARDDQAPQLAVSMTNSEVGAGTSISESLRKPADSTSAVAVFYRLRR